MADPPKESGPVLHYRDKRPPAPRDRRFGWEEPVPPLIQWVLAFVLYGMLTLLWLGLSGIAEHAWKPVFVIGWVILTVALVAYSVRVSRDEDDWWAFRWKDTLGCAVFVAIFLVAAWIFLLVWGVCSHP